MITLLLLVRATYMYGAVLHAHPVRGESHNQSNTTGEVATLLNTFTQLMDARKSRFAPNTPDPLCANYARHMIRFARNGSIQRSPHPSHRLSFKFGIFVCDRNSNTCQKNRARTDLLNKTKI